MSRTEAKEWLADTLGKSGEAAEHVVFVRGRLAGLEPRELRAAKRELGVTDYQGARSRMWRLPHHRPSIAGGEAF
jgi:hypothetical protein